MILTERDNLIINLLQQQDFCFYKDIADKFFSSSTTASLRLKKLKQKGFISIESIYSPKFDKIMDKASMPFIGLLFDTILLPYGQLFLNSNL